MINEIRTNDEERKLKSLYDKNLDICQNLLAAKLFFFLLEFKSILPLFESIYLI